MARIITYKYPAATSGHQSSHLSLPDLGNDLLLKVQQHREADQAWKCYLVPGPFTYDTCLAFN